MSKFDHLRELNFKQVIGFLRKHLLVITCIAANLILITFIFHKQEAIKSIEGQIDSLNVKSNLMTKQMAKLTNVASDLQKYQQLWAEINKNCFDFGDKTALYKFIIKMEELLGVKTNAITITNSYDLTTDQVITINQDISEYVGHYLLVDFKVDVRCSFDTIVSFLQALQHFNYFINIRDLTLKENNAPTTKSNNIISEQIQSTVSATITFTMLGKINPLGGQHA